MEGIKKMIDTEKRYIQSILNSENRKDVLRFIVECLNSMKEDHRNTLKDKTLPDYLRVEKLSQINALDAASNEFSKILNTSE